MGIFSFGTQEGHPDLAMPMKALKSRLLDIHEVTGGKFGPGFSAVKLDHPDGSALLPEVLGME